MGPGQCKTCAHSDRELIDDALASGQSLASLSALYGMSKPSLARHRDNHLAARVAAAAARREELIEASAGKIVDRLARLADAAEVYALSRLAAGAPNAPQALREARETLARVGELRGEGPAESDGIQRAKGMLEQLMDGLRAQRDDEATEL